MTEPRHYVETDSRVYLRGADGIRIAAGDLQVGDSLTELVKVTRVRYPSWTEVVVDLEDDTTWYLKTTDLVAVRALTLPRQSQAGKVAHDPVVESAPAKTLEEARYDS